MFCYLFTFSEFSFMEEAQNHPATLDITNDPDNESNDEDCETDDFITLCGLVLLCLAFLSLMLFLVIYLNYEYIKKKADESNWLQLNARDIP